MLRRGWSAHGLCALQLPEPTRPRRARRLRPGAVVAPPSPLAQRAIAGVSALLQGERVDLSALPLGLLHGVPRLHVRIYGIMRRIRSCLPVGQAGFVCRWGLTSGAACNSAQ